MEIEIVSRGITSIVNVFFFNRFVEMNLPCLFKIFDNLLEIIISNISMIRGLIRYDGRRSLIFEFYIVSENGFRIFQPPCHANFNMQWTWRIEYEVWNTSLRRGLQFTSFKKYKRTVNCLLQFSCQTSQQLTI